MGTAAPFTWAPVAINSSSLASDGGFTRSESALFAKLSLGGGAPGQFPQIGLVQNFKASGQSGNGPVKGIGEPFSENKPGDMYFTVTIGNFSIRTRRLVDLVLGAYGGANGSNQTPVTNQNENFTFNQNPTLDFRLMPFEIDIESTVRDIVGNIYDDTQERYCGLYIQTWDSAYDDTNALRLEGVTGWCSGWQMLRNGQTIATMGNLPVANGQPTAIA